MTQIFEAKKRLPILGLDQDLGNSVCQSQPHCSLAMRTGVMFFGVLNWFANYVGCKQRSLSTTLSVNNVIYEQRCEQYIYA